MEKPPFILSNKFLALSVIGTILILFGAILAFTSPAWFNAFELSDKYSEIGDSINGITAPITSLLGSVLLFVSFRAQFEANRLIQSQWEYDTFVKEFSNIEKEFENLKYSYNLNSDTTEGVEIVSNITEPKIIHYLGSEAIEHIVNNIESKIITGNSIAIMNDISYILDELITLVIDIQKSKLTEKRKSFLFRKIIRFYFIKFDTDLIKIIDKFINHKKTISDEDKVKYPYDTYIDKILKSKETIEKLHKEQTNLQ